MVAIVSMLNGEFVKSAEFTKRVENLAERWCGLLVVAFQALGEITDKHLALPQVFLLDFVATLELWSWEEDGLRPVLAAAGLPSAAVAGREVLARAKRGASSFIDSQDAIYRQVWNFSLRNFAWEAPNNSDILLGVGDEDAFVEQLAALIWRHRDTSIFDEEA